MRTLCTLTLLATLLAAPSRALELRRVGELRFAPGGTTFDWLGTDRFVRLGNEWERTPKGALRAVTFVVADVREQKLLRLPFALDAFQRAHPSLFPGPPNADLVHFDGTSALLRFDQREPMRTIAWYSVWNPATQEVTEPRQLGEAVYVSEGGKKRLSRLTWLVGPDPGAGRLYFADITYDDRPSWKQEPIALRFFRVGFPDLVVDDWALELAPPRRDPQLPIETYRAFSHDGRYLAFAEYDPQRKKPAVPPPQLFVLDLEGRKVTPYPAPRTPYGLSFSRDGRYLAVGSHEEAEIFRIDLEAGRIDRRVKAQTHIQRFETTASGESLLVMSDHIGAPRPIEVRRWSDLALQETIPVSRLFPGVAGFHPSGTRATGDGRLLVAQRYGKDGYPDSADAGLVIFSIDEGATSAARPDPTAAVRPHVERTGLRLYSYHLGQVGNGEGRFAPIVGNAKGEAFVIGTRSDLPEDAPYQAGKSHPFAIWVDAKGKVLWQRSLRGGKPFVDYEGASAVAAPDGGFIALLLCYGQSGAFAASRLVKLDRGGKVAWEWTSPIGREARFPEELRLEPGGTVFMKGHGGSTTTPWIGELDARTGRLLREEVGKTR